MHKICHTAPEFWGSQNVISTMLLPFSVLYGVGHEIHCLFKKPKSVSVPVLIIGNLIVGGAGKTPTACALMQFIKKHELAKNPVFLSRGYGGKITAPTRVDPRHHTYQDIGDEPLLLARYAPTYISRNRYDGALFAIQQGADLIITDDGLQNRDLLGDINLAILDHRMLGNRRVMPAGALRGFLKTGLKNIDAFVGLNVEDSATGKYLKIPFFTGKIHERVKDSWFDQDFIAFCSIAAPQKFINSLKKHNLKIKGQYFFPDHHPYALSDLKPLLQDAKQKNTRLMTTEKDWVRLPSSVQKSGLVDVMPITVQFSSLFQKYIYARLKKLKK
jgi:tetraacyldisaccharide 4'-kinase